MDEELERILTDLAEQISRTETIARENRNFANDLKTAVDAIVKRLDKGDDRFALGKESIEALQAKVDILTRNDAEGLTAIEKAQRALVEMESRFAGKTLTGMSEQPSYEQAVSVLLSLRTRLGGGEGQLSYEAVRRSIEDSRFLGTVVKGLIGLFGIGAFFAAGNALIGGENLSPALIRVQEEVKDLNVKVEQFRIKLEGEDRDRIRRLEEGQRDR